MEKAKVYFIREITPLNIIKAYEAVGKKLSGKARLKLLFTAYHNKNMTEEELKENNFVRVNGWKEVEEILLK